VFANDFARRIPECPNPNALKLLTLARDLRRRKAREKQALFAAEGVRTVEELLRSPLPLRGALVSDRIGETARGSELREIIVKRGIELLEVSDADFATAAETESPQGILAIAEIPDMSLDTLQVGREVRLVVLDAVQDPGNAGTIIRTAAALGASAVIAMPGTVDLWNAKVVRSGMGASFHIPVRVAGWDEFNSFTRTNGVSVWGADADGEPLEAMTAPDRLALTVGNEGAGLSTTARQGADRFVALPIGSAVESLNVAVATGILLYQLRS
jgi:TrmH family RNA methyltransferase